MNSIQIEEILSRDSTTRKYFLGVFPSNHLPLNIECYPVCFVCNVDSCSELGSHWVAFFLSKPDEMEFFDSYGNAPSFFQGSISNYTSRFSHVTYNPIKLQSHTSAVCGQFCVYYLYHRCRGNCLKGFLKHFVAENICNDHKVYNFVSKKFRVFVNFYQ